MNSSQNLPISKQPSEPIPMAKPCKHPRVRVVAREEDAEFVECQECGDVFESSEFKDMAIEENMGLKRPEFSQPGGSMKLYLVQAILCLLHAT